MKIMKLKGHQRVTILKVSLQRYWLRNWKQRNGQDARVSRGGECYNMVVRLVSVFLKVGLRSKLLFKHCLELR